MVEEVKGLSQLQRRFRTLPDVVRTAARIEMEKGAEEFVAMMKRLVPRESGKLAQSIGWTWGSGPAGSMTIASFKAREFGTMRITIYAGDGAAFYARWVEFGTRPHSVATNASVDRGLRQGQGKMHPGATAKPFFYPSIRALKRRVKSRITRAITKAAKAHFGG